MVFDKQRLPGVLMPGGFRTTTYLCRKEGRSCASPGAEPVTKSGKHEPRGEWQCATRGLERSPPPLLKKTPAAAPNFWAQRDRDAVPPHDVRRVAKRDAS